MPRWRSRVRASSTAPFLRCHSQVVRQRSAKPSFSSSNLDGTSQNESAEWLALFFCLTGFADSENHWLMFLFARNEASYAVVTNCAANSNSFPQEMAVTGGVQRGLKSPLFNFSAPLWALFGYFLSQQKVTTSRPQTRREQRKNQA